MSAKGASIASMLVGSAALAIITGKRATAAAAQQQPTTPRAPAPSQLPPVDPSVPTTPTAPTEQPRPRAPAAEFKFSALHRYALTVDVLPVKGVGLTTVAKQALQTLRFEDASLKGYKTVERDGVGEVTRVSFEANAITGQTLPFDRQLSIAGVGSVWLVSAKETAP